MRTFIAGALVVLSVVFCTILSRGRSGGVESGENPLLAKIPVVSEGWRCVGKEGICGVTRFGTKLVGQLVEYRGDASGLDGKEERNASSSLGDSLVSANAVIGGSDDEEFFADRGNTPDSASKATVRKPGCYGTGFCGTTKEGKRLEGKWRE